MRATSKAAFKIALAAIIVAGCSNTKSGISDSEPDAAVSDQPQCSDHVDNDGDGKTDFPADPGCLNPNQNSETDDCPDGPGCPQCGNGKDDDGDGLKDYGADPDCSAASDPSEQGVNFNACGSDVEIKPMPANGVATGTMVLGSSHMISNCGGLGSEVAYQIDVTAPITFTASRDSGNVADVVLYLRSAACTDDSMERACSDGVTELSADLVAGTYYLVIDGATNASEGAYAIRVITYPGQGGACDATHACAPGHFCRTAPGATTTTCQPPHCSDSYDDDTDQKTDFPNDPGCSGPTDDDETDDCPSGPGCPACGNGKDDDNDQKTDFPADPDCKSASQAAEACGTEMDPIGVLSTSGTATGDNTTYHDDFSPSCGSAGGLDAAYLFTVPTMESLVVSTEGTSFDSVLALYGATCDGTALACNDTNPDGDGSKVTLSNVAAGTYAAIVDGYDDLETGAYTISVTGVIAAGGRCDVSLFTAGALACASGSACNRTICKGMLECNDGVDNDNDQKADYPLDPGCDSPNDTTEGDDCPNGVNCPACSNGKDDDHDQKTDYPNDPSCRAASGTAESCTTVDPILTLTMPSTAGTNVGANDDFASSCGSSSATGPDQVYELDVPALATLTVDMSDADFDEVIEVLDASCGGADLGCNDTPGSLTLTNVAAGTYYVVADGYYDTATGSYNLKVSGQIVPDGSCEGALAKSGALTCTAGYACSGAPGATACKPAACNDGMDNDNDQKKDFPKDPGCASPSDNDETDDCPNGPNCPVCSNGKDDDNDQKTDYPADPGCSSASASSESCPSVDPIGELVAAKTDGDTTGHANDFHATCGGNPGGDGADDIWLVNLPKMSKLTIDADDNAVDIIAVLYDATCGGTELACEDSPETMDFPTGLAAGQYYVMIDTDFGSSDEGPYNIVVSGEIAADGSCEVPLAKSGAITCATGYSCQGAPGATACKPAACNDGMDNDNDQKKDFPNDPGCSSPSDNDETDDCPNGPNCPVCSNGKDDDLDQKTDYPADTSCKSAAGTSESCASIDPIGVLVMPMTAGTTTTATDDFAPTCAGSPSAPDQVFALDVPAMTTLTVDMSVNNFDEVAELLDGTCAGTALACSDTPGTITRTNVTAGRYYFVADGYGATDTGTFLITVTGTIASGGSCEGALATSGAITCVAGTTCKGNPGVRTCAP
jgi:hypothetical protein